MAAVACPPSHPNCGIAQMDPSHIEQLDISTDFFASTHAINVSKDPPTESQLESVASYSILTEDGESVPFQDLWQHDDRSRRTLVVFVRHFFCGNCQEYLRTLSETITQRYLDSLSQPTDIAIIGCGQPDLIQFYRETTKCPYPIYADPSRELYVRLGMARTMAPGEKKPDYVRKSMLGIVASGITQGMTAGKNAMKGGDFWQVGGEFFFEGGSVTHCHRMSTTRDHAEMPEIKQWLGAEESEDEETDDERRQKKSMRSTISDLGASVRRSISRRRSSSRSAGSRKASESSSTTQKNRRESMQEVKE